MPQPVQRGLAPLATAILLTACAGTAAPGDTPGDPLQAPERFSIIYSARAAEAATELTIAPDRAWEVLPDVFRDLGLPAAPATSRERVMMTPHMRIKGELYAGEPTSDYLACGNSRAGGRRADVYEVTFVIITRIIEVDSSRTRVATIVDGHADNPLRRGSHPCRSTGRFEEQINELLAARARGGS